MKRNLFLICGLFFCLSASSQVPFVPPAPSFEPLPKTLYENGDYSRTIDIYYFANPEFTGLRQEISALESETRGRYFDNHGTSYTLHPMECHLIGGSATAGIARIGARPTATALDESASSSTSSSKILYNDHIVICRNGRLYDLLGR